MFPQQRFLSDVSSFMGPYCVNSKTVNTRIISGILLCCEEKANQVQDDKTTNCNGN